MVSISDYWHNIYQCFCWSITDKFTPLVYRHRLKKKRLIIKFFLKKSTNLLMRSGQISLMQIRVFKIYIYLYVLLKSTNANEAGHFALSITCSVPCSPAAPHYHHINALWPHCPKPTRQGFPGNRTPLLTSTTSFLFTLLPYARSRPAFCTNTRPRARQHAAGCGEGRNSSLL